jgi:hypothetical protein
LPNQVKPIQSCGTRNELLNDVNASSSCSNGNAHTCYNLSPWVVSSTLAFGFAATQSGDVCGRCYQLQFTGSSHNSNNDPGSQALSGKTMIVQAINIGGDVSGGQFDILVPGGGVGLFNACSKQWGVTTQELGAQYGGMLRACKDSIGFNATKEQYKSCLAQKCDSVFGSRGLTDLQAGCKFYADWFEAADNPALKYKEVACPAEIIAKTGMDRRPVNDISRSCGN